MMNQRVISALNNLVEVCKDGEQGFRTAANALSNAELRRLFTMYAAERAQFAAELQSIVRQLGGEPETSGSVAASLHRGWMNIKSAVARRNDRAVIAEAERGEDAAKQAYQQALGENLPPDVRGLIDRQYARVREAHDRVRTMERAA